ncbi:MAG: signal recognition particle-docking protein FtsY [Acidimicrobiia bacterium]|nr:signal recognition particle-docking protein FtsY [Acidimicrobiia bacterium]MDH4308024.1 signal recognition particle-docking protein FtsY [Acidimicrobiia bacterium]MDH5294585.1 signal recognition particle-docking protein FtsY [Acidimicrobiia bacterium]
MALTPLELLGIVVAVLAVVAVVVGLVVSRRPKSIEREVAEARKATRAPAGDLGTRLSKSRSAFGGALRSVLGRGALDDAFWDSLTEVLIGSDVGVGTSTDIVDRVRAAGPGSPAEAREALRSELLSTFSGKDRSLHLDGRPAVVMVVGVNGTGKTTSIAKIAKRLDDEGRSTLLGAADTFRAAADTQLRTWAERVGVDVVSGQTGADPASVAFDAVAAAKARGKDVVIIDTAGRLHSKKNLMDELSKLRRVVEREAGSVDEVLLVLDATAGQNGIAQARQFGEATGVTGIVLSKLDGTARGGVVVAIEHELGVPVKFIGVGEAMGDMIPFEPDAFIDALLEEA